MTLAKNGIRNRGWWSGLLVLACCLFIGATTNAQDFCPQEPISVCGLPGTEVCVPLPISGADQVLVDGGSWSDGKLCFTPAAYGQNDVTVKGVFGTDTTQCVVTVMLNEGTKPTITCPSEPFEISMCGPGLACIAAPLTKDAGRVFAQGAEMSGGNLCVNVDTSGTYYITLYAVNDCGADSCTVTVNVKINTKPEIVCPKIPKNGVPVDRCGAGTVCYPLSVTGADTVTVPHGGSYSGGQICFIADTTGHYTYTVYAQNQCGVTQCTLKFDVTINDVPVIACPTEAIPVVTCAGSVCVPLSIENADSVTVTGATYENGQLCFTADTTGQYAFGVVTYNGCGSNQCGVTVSVTITNPPVISCESTIDTAKLCMPGLVCVALPITGADSVLVQGSTWADGQFCFFAKSSNTYSFTVIAMNACGSDTCSVTRTVEIVPAIAMTCPDTTLELKICGITKAGCVAFPISGADSVRVSILDGPEGASSGWHDSLISLAVVDTGLYHLNVVAYNQCRAESCTVAVHASYGETVAFTCPDTTLQIKICGVTKAGCADFVVENADSVRVSILEGAEGASAGWHDNLISLAVVDTGLYRLKVVAYAECGADSCELSIHVSYGGDVPLITCPMVELSDTVCELPDSVSFPLAVLGAEKVIVFSDDAQASWESGIVTFVAADHKLYSFTVVATNDCGSDTCLVSINILQTPAPVITCPEGDLTVAICDTGHVCIPLSITNASDVIIKGGGATYEDGQLCFFADTAGRYGYLVMATSACGTAQCGVGVNIILGESPTACFAAKPDSGAVPLTVQFTNCSITTGDAKFHWNFGDSTNSTDTAPTHVFEAAGCYEVTLTVTTSCGQSTTSHTVCATGGQIIVPTPEWINVYCATPMLDSVSLQAGDVITAYDPDGVLCGMDIVRNDGQFGFMPVYRDDIYSLQDEGAEPGDVISFRVNGTQVYPTTPVTWTQNGDSYQLCDFLTHTPVVCKTLHLHEGWNLISWNVAWNSGIQDFIADYAECIDVILGFDQGALTYDPNLQEYSTLWNVDYHFGYWFKMNCAADVQICGNPIDPNDGISIHQGWNLISYWPEDTLSVEDGFASIIDQVQVALGYNSTGLVYQPGQGSFNTLTELNEFGGYWVRSSADVLFGYPGFTPSGSTVVAARGNHDLPISHNWISVYGKALTLDGSALTAGSTIEMHSQQGTVCGSAVYNGSILKFTPVYGADGSETIQYPKNGESVQVFVNGERTYPDLVWEASGARVDISSRFSTSDHASVPTSYNLAQNYPNPFNPTTKISFSLKQAEKVRLMVYNVLGQQIATIANGVFAAGEHAVEWNGRDDAGKPVTSGVYFYRIDTPSFTQTKKMVLTK